MNRALYRNADPAQEANAAGSRGRQGTLLFVVNVAFVGMHSKEAPA